MKRISVASKTFLVGEYIATQGDPCIVLNTSPRFYADVEGCEAPGSIEGITIESPAGQLIRQNSEAFSQFNFRFSDPHNGLGGLGASTAQVAAAIHLLFQISCKGLKTEDWPKLLQTYMEIAWSGQGTPPSGADFLSQCFGNKIFYWNRNDNEMKSFDWPFADHGFYLVRTGRKQATHTHLRDLDGFESAALMIAARKTYQALKDCKVDDFADGVNDYKKALAANQLTCEPTLELLSKIEKIPHVLASKGCGALGADTLFVLFENANAENVKKQLAQLDLQVIADTSSLSGALQEEAL